jgi:two-component system response regulator (stage 0 sporulation protein A)
MATLEQKLDLIMGYIVEDDPNEKNRIKEEIMKVCCEVAPTPEDHTLDDIIDDFLTEIGMPCQLIGYKYVVTAIKMVIDDVTYLDAITSRLYVQIAEQHDVTASRVERNMRHAVERTWDRMPFGTMDRLFGNVVDPVRGKPTNSEFIATCRKIITRRMRNLR